MPMHPVSDHKIVPAQESQRFGDIAGIILSIAIEQDHVPAQRLFDPGEQSSALAGILEQITMRAVGQVEATPFKWFSVPSVLPSLTRMTSYVRWLRSKIPRSSVSTGVTFVSSL